MPQQPLRTDPAGPGPRRPGEPEPADGESASTMTATAAGAPGVVPVALEVPDPLDVASQLDVAGRVELPGRLATPDPTEDEVGFQRALGQRLREVRRRRGLTLQDVEDRSDGRWKAVVVGSYERADRAVSAVKLAALAAFYGADLSEVLGATPARLGGPLGLLDLDTDALAVSLSRHPELGPLARFVDHVRWQRGEQRARVVAIRADDLRALAVAMGIEVDDLGAWLQARGVLATHVVDLR